MHVHSPAPSSTSPSSNMQQPPFYPYILTMNILFTHWLLLRVAARLTWPLRHHQAIEATWHNDVVPWRLDLTALVCRLVRDLRPGRLKGLEPKPTLHGHLGGLTWQWFDGWECSKNTRNFLPLNSRAWWWWLWAWRHLLYTRHPIPMCPIMDSLDLMLALHHQGEFPLCRSNLWASHGIVVYCPPSL